MFTSLRWLVTKNKKYLDFSEILHKGTKYYTDKKNRRKKQGWRATFLIRFFYVKQYFVTWYKNGLFTQNDKLDTLKLFVWYYESLTYYFQVYNKITNKEIPISALIK